MYSCAGSAISSQLAGVMRSGSSASARNGGWGLPLGKSQRTHAGSKLWELMHWMPALNSQRASCCGTWQEPVGHVCAGGLEQQGCAMEELGELGGRQQHACSVEAGFARQKDAQEERAAGRGMGPAGLAMNRQ